MSAHDTFQPIGGTVRKVIMDAALASGVIQKITITDREQWLALRGQDVTASVIGALVGVHDYQTPYGLYMEKAGLAPPQIDDVPVITEDSITLPPMLRGTLFEPAALQMLRQLRPAWTVTEANDTYFRMPSARIGATPDAYATDPMRPGRGIVQIKTTSDIVFAKKWRDEDGNLQVPLWIACQAITEAKVTGSSWACVILMVSGMTTRLHLIEIPLIEGLWERLTIEVGQFWQRIGDGRAYDPDYGRDGEILSRLYAQDDGTEIDLSTDNRIFEVIAERDKLKAVEKAGSEAEKARKALDTEIIAKLGHATRGRLVDGSVISAKAILVNRKPSPASTYSYRKITITEGAAA